MPDTKPPDIFTVFDQLCAEHELRQPHEYEANGTAYETHHVTTSPALIDQLRESVEPSSNAKSGKRGTAGSKPSARIEAIDTYIVIDKAAAKWVRELGEDDPGDTIACIRKLAGLRASADAVAVKAIDQDVRRWWAWSRIVTGWDVPAIKLRNNTCMQCDELGTLRIRVEEMLATCIECREVWEGRDQLGVLGEHIRKENNDDSPREVKTEGQAA